MSSDWYKQIPVVGEIDSWFNSDSWQERAFHKLKRTVLLRIIAIDILSYGLAKHLAITAGIASTLLWNQDWDAFKTKIDQLSDDNARALYQWLHLLSPLG